MFSYWKARYIVYRNHLHSFFVLVLMLLAVSPPSDIRLVQFARMSQVGTSLNLLMCTLTSWKMGTSTNPPMLCRAMFLSLSQGGVPLGVVFGGGGSIIPILFILLRTLLFLLVLLHTFTFLVRFLFVARMLALNFSQFLFCNLYFPLVFFSSLG